MQADSLAIANREKRSAAMASVAAAVFLTTIKLLVGLMTGSLGILSEAAHSGLDLVAALATLLAVRLSARPADRNHLYGHGKIENLSALLETLLLLLTCIWIVYEAIQRIFYRTVHVEPSLWAFLVVGISIVVDINRSRMLYRAARKHGSQALEADALHFATDIWSSVVVLAGLAIVWLSEQLGPQWQWLIKADAVAALGVAILVTSVSLRLGSRAIAVLMDAAPVGLTDRVAAEVARVRGVQAVGPVRVRQSGAATFVDLEVDVDRSASLQEAHQIASQVELRVGGLVRHSDVVVHVNPVKKVDESLPHTVSALATRIGLRTHNVYAHEMHGQYTIDLHVEVPAGLSLRQAHGQVSALEKSIYDELPHVEAVHSHIEPLALPTTPADSLSREAEADLRSVIAQVTDQVFGADSCADLRIRTDAHGYDVVLRCRARPDLLIEEAHRLADEVEKRLRSRVRGINQVLVRVEPGGES